MTTQIFKTALAGILAGIALFMFPFILVKAILFFLIIGAIFRLLGFRHRHRFGKMKYAYAQRFANMSDEEKTAFKHSFSKHSCYTPFEEAGHSDLNHKTN